MKTKKIILKGAEIKIIEHKESDYISLTDKVKGFGDDTMIYSWIRKIYRDMGRNQ